ncbi:hypothetical protein BDW42DRAFT_166857 [Aspergillus taichungensis]|uniref:Sulfate transporter n=1 Tax=Aspergillus taichungensis TaxID=482145 RepID=A0A2J5HYQ3_9EURO|nr:hypothetical protein BDW42DRAFT_166857 [Aspergillus taichungensis]
MNLHRIASHNLHTFRHNPTAEISGALGDLGTFLPIAIALALQHSVSLSATLVWSGLCNILTGVVFGIPLPVQPMKAIAAVALARDFGPKPLAAAGIFVGACLAVFSVTGLLHRFSHAIPIPVIKGIQIGAGLSLIIAAGSNMLSSLHWVHPSWADNRIWAVAAFLGLVIANVYRRVPYALILFALGIVFAIIRTAHAGHLPALELWRPSIIGVPGPHAWRIGALDAGLGQLPLTTLNSVVAVVYLAADLLPEVPTPTVTAVGLSVAAMNLTGCWLGAMPVCHGSGGLAAQHRFGARSGASVILLGAVKVVVGVFFGESLLPLLKRFPSALLGVMVIAAGLELASVGESLNTTGARDLAKARPLEVLGDDDARQEIGPLLSEDERKRRWMVMLVTVGMLVGFKNDAIGFAAGMLCHWGYQLPGLVEGVRARWRRGIQLA